MNNGLEIRWPGRGGQGAKTAALLLADVAFKTGKYVQGFPEYGPERMGAPITAYNRISDEVIRVHLHVVSVLHCRNLCIVSIMVLARQNSYVQIRC